MRKKPLKFSDCELDLLMRRLVLYRGEPQKKWFSPAETIVWLYHHLGVDPVFFNKDERIALVGGSDFSVEGACRLRENPRCVVMLGYYRANKNYLNALFIQTLPEDPCTYKCGIGELDFESICVISDSRRLWPRESNLIGAAIESLLQQQPVKHTGRDVEKYSPSDLERFRQLILSRAFQMK